MACSHGERKIISFGGCTEIVDLPSQGLPSLTLTTRGGRPTHVIGEREIIIDEKLVVLPTFTELEFYLPWS